MSPDTVTATAMPAESLAEHLTHWQVLDIVYVAQHGNLKLGSAPPWKPLAQLIQYGILKYASSSAKYLVLVPTHRFKSVLYALERSGRIASRKEVVL